MEENNIQPAEKKKKRKLLGNVKRWRLRDYTLQLVVVVVGILITFQGNALIQKRTQKREMESILSMVSDELRQNLKEVRWCMRCVDQELDGMGFFLKYAGEPRKAPRDSVYMYLTVLETGHKFDFKTNSLEVLKASHSSINAMDKYLLSMVFQCYDELNANFHSINYYYDRKFRTAGDFFFSLDRNTIEITWTKDPYPYVEKFIKNPATGNMIYTVRPNMGPRVELLQQLEALMEETVWMIDLVTSTKKGRVERVPRASEAQ